MPERKKPPVPLVQVNLGVGIGGINRNVATGENNGPKNPWEEQSVTDWSAVVRRQVYDKGPRKDGHRFSGRATGDPRPGIECRETGIVPDDVQGRLKVLLQFLGVDLSGARFMVSDRYRRPAGSDSAVYARLDSGVILVLGTYGDIIECQIGPTARPPIYRNEYHIPELALYDPRWMAVSVRDNLVTLRYNRLPP